MSEPQEIHKIVIGQDLEEEISKINELPIDIKIPEKFIPKKKIIEMRWKMIVRNVIDELNKRKLSKNEIIKIAESIDGEKIKFQPLIMRIKNILKKSNLNLYKTKLSKEDIYSIDRLQDEP